MGIDLVNIVATFGAAIAGSWFGSRATHKQTEANIELQQKQTEANIDLGNKRFRQEAAYEFLEALDNFQAISFKKDVKEIEYNKIGQRLNTLAMIVIPEKHEEAERLIFNVRNLHLDSPGACKYKYDDCKEKHFDPWREEASKIFLG